MSDVEITILPNGPYLVKGGVDVVDPTGKKTTVKGEKPMALCRCGASAKRPFCDGQHAKIGFQSAETFPEA